MLACDERKSNELKTEPQGYASLRLAAIFPPDLEDTKPM